MERTREPTLEDRLGDIRSRISDAAAEAHRDPSSITTVVVTKFHSASLVRDLHALGVRDVGESRHQEASAKHAELTDLDLRWHFVGQLQSKKARQVLEYARVIHSLDRTSLVDALVRSAPGSSDDGGGGGLPDESGSATVAEVFIQINLSADRSRGGVAEADLDGLVENVIAHPLLRLAGVMAVAPLDEEPRRAFARLRIASDRVAAAAPGALAISAGMSGDFREAILEGATHLRIGSAITGNRVAPG